MALLDFLRPQQRALEPAQPQAVKATTGSGAFAMTYDSAISSGRWDTPAGMKRAQALSHANPWIDKAERLISSRAAGMPWHLEDADDETVDDDSPEAYRAVRDLLERPNPQMTWRQLATLTYRHMGVCNVGAWYLDALSGQKIPEQVLYLNPARLTPYAPGGVLTKWVLDADNDYGWNPTILELDEVILFVLNPPDYGFFGQGLVEVAESKRRLSEVTDRYSTHTFASGGRRGSWIMPREGRLPEDVYDGLVNSMKNIRESYDAAKRDIVTKAPLDITPQAATAQELQAAEVMGMARDDLLVIWGVDVQDAGVPGAGGLSSGQLRQQARQSTYENAIDPRVDVLAETVQLRFLDRWKALGVNLELVIDRPTWEDETPAYDRASKALQLPLRNSERRAIVGLDPFGDPVLDNAVWLPAGISEAYVAPDEDGNPVEVPEPEVVVAPAPPPQLPPGELFAPAKASLLGRTRQTVDARITPAMRKAVAKVLADQRDATLALVREKASHLMAKPGDVRAVFNQAKFEKALRAAIAPHARAAAETVATETKRSLGHLNPAKAEQPSFLDDVIGFVLDRGGDRVTEMGTNTRSVIEDAIRSVITGAVDAGLGPADVANRLTDVVGNLGSAWGDARAETIARTETMFAYNDAALKSYREYDVERVEAIDGDEDTECADRNGQTFSLDEALSITDHPNGTLDWLPVIKAVIEPDPAAEAWKAIALMANREQPTPIVNVYPPDIHVTTPDVHVTTPPVTVHPAEVNVHPATVNVTVPGAAKAKTVQRDDQGRITGITEEAG